MTENFLKEKAIEDAISDWLTTHGGYQAGNPDQFNRMTVWTTRLFWRLFKRLNRRRGKITATSIRETLRQNWLNGCPTPSKKADCCPFYAKVSKIGACRSRLASLNRTTTSIPNWLKNTIGTFCIAPANCIIHQKTKTVSILFCS